MTTIEARIQGYWMKATVQSAIFSLAFFGAAHGAIELTCTPTRVDTSNKFPCPVTVHFEIPGMNPAPGATISAVTGGNATVSPPGPVNSPAASGTFAFDAGCGVGVGGGTVTFTATRTAAGHGNETASCTVDVICVTPVAEADNKKLLKGTSQTVTVTLKGMKCVQGAVVDAAVQPAIPPSTSKVTVEGFNDNHVGTGNTQAPVINGKAHFKVTCAAGNWGSTTQEINFSVPNDPGNSYDKTITVTCNPPPTACNQSPNGCQSIHPEPGCNDVTCCDSVCDVNPQCCNESWGPECVQLAATVCPAETCGNAPGSCCAENPGASCSDGACCSLVCGQDPWCCTIQWDQLCADKAAELCGGECLQTVPTVSQWGVLIMAGLLTSAGAMVVRRIGVARMRSTLR